MSKKIISLLLVLLLTVQTVLTGCDPAAGNGNKKPESAAEPVLESEETNENRPTAEADSASEPESGKEEVLPEAESSPEPEKTKPAGLKWATAFRDPSLPEGYVTPDCAAFYDGSGETPEIVNVPLEEIYAWEENCNRLPRAHYFEQYMTQDALELLPLLDYALVNGYWKICVPSATITDNTVRVNSKLIARTIAGEFQNVTALTRSTQTLADGTELHYTLIAFPYVKAEHMTKIREGLAAAKEIVDEMPEDLNEAERALYLYSWVTENIRYYDYTEEPREYYDDTEENFIYDAFINRCTVCTGYTEALFVLYNMAGIECIWVCGTIDAFDGHIWNIAQIDGEWYQFDSTWDEGIDPSEYRFFAISDRLMQFFYKRVIDQYDLGYAPACPYCRMQSKGAERIRKLAQSYLDEHFSTESAVYEVVYTETMGMNVWYAAVLCEVDGEVRVTYVGLQTDMLGAGIVDFTFLEE